MWRLTLAQMRRSVGRLAAAGIAIAIGTAFVAATLLAGNVITRTSYDAVTASYGQADLVLSSTSRLSLGQLDQVRALPQVAAADPVLIASVKLHSGARTVWQPVVPVSSDPALDPQAVTSGALPARSGEIALPAKVADRLHVELGSDVQAEYDRWVPASSAPAGSATPAPSATTQGADRTTATATADTSGTAPGEGDGTWETATTSFRLVGLVDDPNGAYSQYGSVGVLPMADLLTVYPDVADYGFARATVLADPTAGVDATRTALAAAVPDAEVQTRDEAARTQIAEISDGSEVFTGVVLAFAAVALIVAALVIANTFQVLVAQRTRTLALLRCVGAVRGQLRRSVLLEAAILGGIASVVGLLAGTALAQLALVILRGSDLPVPLPDTVTITPAVVLAPLLLGVLVTVGAALVPARVATRVSPIAALRPVDAGPTTGHLARLVTTWVLTLGGAALLAIGVAAGTMVDPMVGLGLAVLGGATSFVGILVGAVFWIPKVVGLAGRALARTGTSAKLAAANTVRNPRRTAATSTALLIGVTLVAMMSTGAVSARQTLGTELDTRYPVDVEVASTDTSSASDAAGTSMTPRALPSSVTAQVGAVAGIATMVPVRSASVIVTGGDVPLYVPGNTAAPADLHDVLRNPAAAADLDDGTVIVSAGDAENVGITDGQTVTVQQELLDASGQAVDDAPSAELTARVTDLAQGVVLLSPTTLDTVAPGTGVNVLWLRLADVNDAGTVIPAVQDAVTDTPVRVTGSAQERYGYQRLIDTLLGIVVGLLAVAVVIALIGVANTLSLSVLERRRESATLRAIGLSRRQLRWTLAVEGMLIAGVGAVLGVALGLVYGWAGAAAVLGSVGSVHLAVPWRDLGIVLVVALAAGLLASVLPGRAAARTSPVAALAVD
ncbi:ABC transporter permease [Cellulomonas hominis]